MGRILGLALLALVGTVGPSWASGFTEKGLSLLGYQLCSHRVTRSVQRVEAVQTSRVTYVACGGWIPWRRCPKTVYRTQYVVVEVPEPRNVTDCCAGYEQLGLYCVLPLNQSGEFASRPGACPTARPAPSNSTCSVDADCPGLQKCCPWPGGPRCLVPTPPAQERNSGSSWYNVTVLVKMDFKDLEQVDPGLLSHVRLLCSLVTSALQPLESTVHHLHSAGGDTSTTVSRLLLGLPRPLPVANVSAMLDDIVRRVYEVIHVQVQDVNECFYDALNACSAGELCANLEGSYQCVRAQESPASASQELDHTSDDCPPIRDYVVLNVTSSSFRVSWSINSSRSRAFHVQVFRGEELLRSAGTEGLALAVAGLEAGALYVVKTSYQGCGTNISAALTVKTDARVFEVTIRILNRNLTEQLLNRSSVEHREFARQLLHEVENSFPPAVADLHGRGKLRMQIVSLRAGSVVARLRLTVRDPEFPVGVSTLSPMLRPLLASTVFQIDPRGTHVQDWDECADSSEHDCSPAARCVNLEGSYSCQCRTARDANPSRAGRACEGDVVSPTDSVLTLATGLTVPAPSTGATALGPETSTLSPSPTLLQGTSAAGQAQTPAPPPRREGSGTVGHYRNSTGQQMEEELLGNSSMEPPSWPIPAEGPTSHVMWHASLPTRETLLNSTWLRNEDPGHSRPLDLPSAPTPLKAPACGPVSIGRITVSNVTSAGFHLAWAGGLTPRPTFQITLTSTRGPSVRLETRDTSVTLSGLEPGVLHLVEIVAAACGEEGARAHLRVRTAAQKLSGRVRIANVRYLDSFRNTSSQEYRDFLELFFRVVRNSLPDTLLQHVDAGGIRVEVTGIANGSVVVEFHLLLIADVDVREVSATFLAALWNASLLEVVRGDTFIWDYDECEREEDDCVPGTSCQNTLGSFTCRCEGRAPDFHVEYSGRPCEGVSPGSATWAPSPEQTPTPAGTGAALVPGASPSPRDLPQRLNLTGAVRVLCEIEKVAIAIQKRFLQQESIPESSLYLGHPSCNVSDSNSTHVLLVAGWSECGTIVQSNMTSTVVRTTLRNDQSPEVVMHSLKILSPIRCAFQNDLLASSGYTPQWGVYTIIEDLHGAGSFVTEMQLFIGDSPIPQNYSVSASDDVKIEVGLYRQKSGLKVVLTECWATPSSNARDPVTFGFINNSCPVPNTYTSVIENGNSNKAQFKLKIFSFINNSIVYLHCKLRVCMESPGTTCKIDCNDFRLLKSSDSSATHQTSWGPLLRSEGESPGAEPGLGAGYVVLIAVAVLVLVAGAAALLIMRYRRMNGKYNFKVRFDNFSYRVFSE
ncbi:PREDICTED: uromodulin-like 1 [Propithecus coquereli]|uniref:Uromodulin like 1 n=1 Tax=Propithecus coquereli TaxID=379532 RepID=A0A2K6G2L2_PROCO|nr:PREDICTED: uromodulin-like 1 [Propithecus coquereli]